MQSPWYAVSLFALVLIPTIIRSISFYFANRTGFDGERATTATAWRYCGWQFTHLGLIGWAFAAGVITPRSIGLHGDAPLRILIYGTLGWFVVQVASLVLHQLKATDCGVREFVSFQRMLWPRSRSGQFAMIAFLALNPVTEEIITRGVMVRMLGAATASVHLGVGAGLALCLAGHLYQGMKSLPSQAAHSR